MKHFLFLAALCLSTIVFESCDDSSTAAPPTPVPTWNVEEFADSSSLLGFRTNREPWSIRDGAVSCRGATSQSYLIRNDVRFRDGWVEADVDTVDDGGVAIRVQDLNNMVLLALHDNSGPFSARLQSRIQLWIIKNGVYRVIDSSAFDWPRGTKATARLQVVGDTIEAWMDGTRLCRKIDPTIRDSGSVAVRHLGTESDPDFTRSPLISRYLALRWQAR